ncbi:MAG: sulfite exporter TauE/SafE family protein [Alphaproteobacteria bacterium]
MIQRRNWTLSAYSGEVIDIMEFLTQEIGGLALWHWLANMTAIMGAAFMRSFTGFGFAMIAVPVLGLVMPPQEVVPIILTLEIVTGLQLTPAAWPVANRPALKGMVIGSVLLVAPGVYVLGSITDDQMRLLLVAVLALSIILFGWSAKRANTDQQPGGAGSVVAGAGGGFMAGLSGIPGPPVLSYLLGTNLTPDVQRATLLVYFFFIDFLAVAGQFIAGADITSTVTRAAVFLPVLIIGNIIGTRTFNKYGEGNYKPITFGLLLIIGAGLLWRALA